LFSKDFYPTPEQLASDMLSGIDFDWISSVLEPSAGKGDLADAVRQRLRSTCAGCWNKTDWDIDTIELNPELRHILTGKGYRVVHDDFLTYDTAKHYDLIVMNPPFFGGDKHLLKAIKMQRRGGRIVCLLNAETVKNPCTNTRRKLAAKLEEYSASVEFLEKAFAQAERRTDVEIALVKINIPQAEQESDILANLCREAERPEQANKDTQTLIDSDFIRAIIQRYQVEVRAGLKLIGEWRAMRPLIMSSLKSDAYDEPIISMEIQKGDDKSTMENAYIKKVRTKYWEALLTAPEFMGLFTSNLREEYLSRVNELADYEFSPYNIYTIRIELNEKLTKGVEDTILALFDELSAQHAWYPEQKKNIHYFDGWATNKAWKINKKVIIPLSAYDQWRTDCWYRLSDYRVVRKLSDIEKALNYLDGGLTESADLSQILAAAEKAGQTREIQCKYFTVTFYKKGTCHIRFTNDDLLQKFNLYGCQRKGWLPPAYGKRAYQEMSPKEQAAVDTYEGREAYEHMMQNKAYFITSAASILMLAGGKEEVS